MKKLSFNFKLAIIGIIISILLLATSCSNYGNKCLRAGSLDGPGRTKFNK